jgi:uncharacterized protein (PEP-CTERM system associated)
MAVTANKSCLGSTMRTLRRPAFLAGAFSVFALALLANPVNAEDWKFTPSVGAFATYTDNANQSATNPQDALILGVTPSFTLRSAGSRRIQATLTYGLSEVARFSNDNSSNAYHHLSAVGKAELIDDFLFIDGSANISQQLISLLGSPADASINNSNQTTVGTYSISPYIKKRLGTFANLQARYSTSGAIFQKNVAASSASNAFTTSLTSGTQFNDLSWGLNYAIRKVDNYNAALSTNNANNTFESASAQLGYALTRKFRVFGTVGQEWNEYLSSTGTSGSSYSVGFGWAPSRLTSVEASVGHRFFGRTFSFSGSHRTRLSRWTMRYSENVSDISQQFLQASSRIFWVCNGTTLFETPDINPPAGQTGCVGPITAGQLALYYSNYGVSTADLIAAGLLNVASANGVYIIKSFTAGVSWDMGRLGIGLSARDTRRLYQLLSNAQDHIQGVTGTVSYRMSPLTTASSSLSLTRTSLDPLLATSGTGVAFDDLSLSLGLNHRFAEKLNGALAFRHTQRNSDAANSDFQENNITASVNMSF